MRSKTLFIIYERYYDFENNRIVSGGVQTYLNNLIPLFTKHSFCCKIYQAGKRNESIYVNGVCVTNVKVDLNKGYDRAAKILFNTFKNEFVDGFDYIP